MSNTKELIVCTFDGKERAAEAAHAIHELDEKLNTIKLGNIGIIQKNQDGKVEVKETTAASSNWQRWSAGTGTAVAIVAAMTGGAVLVPAVLAGGVAAIAFKNLESGFPDEILKEVGKGLYANHSALVVIVDDPVERDVVNTELKLLGGTLIQHTLSPEHVERLGASIAAAEALPQGPDERVEALAELPMSESGAEIDETRDTSPAVAGFAAGTAAALAGDAKEVGVEAVESADAAVVTAAAASSTAMGAVEDEVSPVADIAQESEAMTAAAVSDIIDETPAGDDLQRLPEVGPVYQRLLTARGITSFAQVARMSPADLQAVFTGDDPESGYPVIPASLAEASRMIQVAARLAAAR